MQHHGSFFMFFFFNDTATTEIYTLSLHDALPISLLVRAGDPKDHRVGGPRLVLGPPDGRALHDQPWRSEEHTSELQSQSNLVCRLLLEKKNIKSAHGDSRWSGCAGVHAHASRDRA